MTEKNFGWVLYDKENVVILRTTTMNDNMPNPTIEGYRTAHRQNKDGSYHFTVMKSDIGCQKLTVSEYIERDCNDEKNNNRTDGTIVLPGTP